MSGAELLIARLARVGGREDRACLHFADMLRGLWDRLMNRRQGARADRETERAGMSRAERRFVDERVEDRQAEGFVEEHLGGIDPERLLAEGEAPREER
jgi:hypothetical protein